MVKHKLTKEPDVFLGEKVIEVRRVGAPRDVWYKLGKYLYMASVFSIHNYCVFVLHPQHSCTGTVSVLCMCGYLWSGL